MSSCEIRPGVAAEVEPCVFCRIMRSESEARAPEDRIIFAEDGVNVLPGLGAQMEGYLMVVPDEHLMSCAQLPESRLSALQSVLHHVLAVVIDTYGPAVVFEHGSCGPEYRAGSCVEHAHLHVLPITSDVARMARERRAFVEVGSVDRVCRSVDHEYLAIYDQAGRLWVGSGVGAPGQFFRRIVAEAMGKPNDWDYEVFRGEDLMLSTAECMGVAFAHRPYLSRVHA